MKRFFNPTFIVLIVIMASMAFLNGRFSNPLDWLMNTMLMLPAIVIGLSFHEFGHAFAAYKLGDMTPKFQGRVTLNPAAHIDPFGFLCLLVAGFGWGVPVQINSTNFKHPRRDELIVALAGVTINFLLAFIAVAVLALFYKLNPSFIALSYMGGVVQEIIQNIIVINLVLMIFNLLPIPPLDGFGVVTQLFNLQNTKFYYQVYDKGFIILMLLIIFNVTGKILSPLVNLLSGFLLGIFF